ncbi:hypothetical protein LIPSTDRAFT_74087 [Lipomyces starkeyi NRRL Y-11557]|uniref:Uncharacterized protein n=1 Tax=Lipomyces starkeyi NRRL Y-11557 TaxID=675824 RepID=A0A1E3Q0G7_LIPST|nr:hypothetical protein LIPSTDRAFT_74087 [Lipomyces starkeyi NRRL Y-11557]
MDPLLRHNIPPIDSELETVDLTNCDAFDDAQHCETESNGRKLVMDATPIPNKDSDIKALIAPQPAIVRDTVRFCKQTRRVVLRKPLYHIWYRIEYIWV